MDDIDWKREIEWASVPTTPEMLKLGKKKGTSITFIKDDTTSLQSIKTRKNRKKSNYEI